MFFFNEIQKQFVGTKNRKKAFPNEDDRSFERRTKRSESNFTRVIMQNCTLNSNNLDKTVNN